MNVIAWKRRNSAANETIGAIADRAEAEAFPIYVNAGVKKREIVMDLTAAHRDIPMDLQKLLGFDALNFAHDVTGIAKNLNRRTGKLENGFLPRSALREGLT